MATRRSSVAPSAAMAPRVHARPWSGWYHRRTTASRARRAIASALERLRATDPAWLESCFDQHLLERPRASAAVATRDAEALARAWSEQFSYRDPERRERDVRSLTPLARTFLRWVDEADGTGDAA